MNNFEDQFLEFRDLYKTQHPASVPTPEQFAEISDQPAWLPYANLLMFISASLLSGVHTINTVYRLMETSSAILPGWVYGLVSLFSFVGVELALMLSAYLIVREKVWGWSILIVTFLFAMSANLYSVSRALASSSDNASVALIRLGSLVVTGETIIAVIIGVAAPLIALMAGKMYVQNSRTERAMLTRAKKAFQDAQVAFDAEVLAAWEKAIKRAGKLPNISISNLSNGIPLENPLETERKTLPANSTLGHKKQPNATQVVGKYLLEHPDALEINPVELAAMLGVGKSTVYNVLKSKRGNLE